VAAAISIPFAPRTEPMYKTIGDTATSTPTVDSRPARLSQAADTATASRTDTIPPVVARPT
jgi:hypothetical protein